MSYTAAVITVSDKGYIGQREDTSGPNLCRILKENGYQIGATGIHPFAPIALVTDGDDSCSIHLAFLPEIVAVDTAGLA